MDMLKFFLLIFCLLVMKSGFTVCENQSFTLAFMTNIGSTGVCDNDLVLYIAASASTNCSVIAPKYDYYTEVITSDVVEITIPRGLALSGSGVEQKGMAVSCNTTVSVYGINACAHNTDGFSVIPNSHLGKEYFAFTIQPAHSTNRASPTDNFYAQVAVVSNTDNTAVSVCLPSCADCQVDINNNTYTPGSCIQQTLNAYESLQIKSKGNLAGTYISGNKPVAVFSGNDKSTLNTLNWNNEHLVVQVPSLQHWGKQFVTIRTWIDNMPISIIAGKSDTIGNITCTGKTTQQINVSAGNIYEMSISTQEHCLIETSHPVFIVQVVGDEDPSLLPLTPIDEYSTSYSFIPPKMSNNLNSVHYFIYVIEKSAESDLMLDSQSIQANSKPVPGTTLNEGYIQITNSLHHVTHPYANFNGVLLGFSTGESYAISLGRNLKATNQSLVTSEEGFTSEQFTIDQLSTTLQNTYFSTIAVTTSAVSLEAGTTTSSNAEIPGSPVCTNTLHGSYFVDMVNGYNGYEIIAEHIMKSIFQCGLQCRRHDLCTSFQFNTHTSSCFLLCVGEGTLDPINGQIFTLEC